MNRGNIVDFGYNYKELLHSINPHKKLGQNFLINVNIAKEEANFAADKKVIEIGPGFGILTNELCKNASKVIAIEKDARLFDILSSNLKCKKLKLVNKDFFDVEKSILKDYDIVIANIPYNLSSKIILWLSKNSMPALLCLQKEFVEHMLAKHGMHNYSKLSVVSSLYFKITKVFDVPASSFYPKPKVDSSVVLIKPIENNIRDDEINVISLLMMHKKKSLRNALADSSSQLNKQKNELRGIADSLNEKDTKIFTMSPNKILAISKEILKQLNQK
ncbi:MAG: 16S rRNA (adenine(1518)-N(6)/adenine(1519)-N(6))-dimethyltransferase RsmA [Candidatus Marsarchaeota archaeon]|jgi:16S rRNA (adenine1518-N6/adenine1519-N6)-dimethyltransferase|nr:16S rRNA (adenine(1518)-N(6)/adenine(1519)-N(6))-dimethyltransferase RsmA [Candidatus Marsarchaeota archaeon]